MWNVVCSDEGLKGHRDRIAPAGALLDALAESMEPEAHIGRLAWATKQAYLNHYVQKRPGCSASNIIMLDASFHQITGPGSSMLQTMVRRYSGYRRHQLVRAKTTPPRYTRAHVRGRVAAHPQLAVISWSAVRRKNSRAQIVYLPNPLSSTIPKALRPYLP
jgi:hypothetical protein